MPEAMALITLALDDKTIDLIAERILKRMVDGLSPEFIQKATGDSKSGLDEFKSPAAESGGDGDEDPWAPAFPSQAGGKTGKTRTAQNAERTSKPARSSARPAKEESSGTFTTPNGWKYTQDPPGGPDCNCGLPAALVEFTSKNNGRKYQAYKCLKGAGEPAGYDYHEACDFSKFINNRKGGSR